MLYNSPSPDELQATIEEGIAAAAVLSSPAFCRVLDDLTNMHIARMLAAPVGAAGQEERERNHALQAALTEITQELMARKAVGEQAQERLHEVDNDD